MQGDRRAVLLALFRSRFLRFLATGALNTAFGYGAFLLGLLIGLGPGQAVTLQFAVGIPFNYAVHGRFVFGQSGFRQLPAYAAVYAGLYVVNLVALKALVLALSPAVAQSALFLSMADLSFLVRSRVLR